MSLLLDRFFEPSVQGVLHLSTLVQQILSVIAERGGVSAADAYRCLVGTGPFRGLSVLKFEALLRGLGVAELLTQMTDGTLLLGPIGERIVNGRDFYAVFSTPEEYRLVSFGRPLGSLPVNFPLVAGCFLIFAGRRWRIVNVNQESRVVDLEPAAGGRPPVFGGQAAERHDRVRERMRALYQDPNVPVYLDSVGRSLLLEGRQHFCRLGLSRRSIVEESGAVHLFPWMGDRVVNTLILLLRARGLDAENQGISVAVEGSSRTALLQNLSAILEDSSLSPARLAAAVPNKNREKYDVYLEEGLMSEEYAARSLDVDRTRATIRSLLDSEDRAGG